VVDASNALVGCLRPVDKKERKRRSSIFEDSYSHFEPNGDEATHINVNSNQAKLKRKEALTYLTMPDVSFAGSKRTREPRPPPTYIQTRKLELFQLPDLAKTTAPLAGPLLENSTSRLGFESTRISTQPHSVVLTQPAICGDLMPV
jgi:hypothetical protein